MGLGYWLYCRPGAQYIVLGGVPKRNFCSNWANAVPISMFLPPGRAAASVALDPGSMLRLTCACEACLFRKRKP